MLRRYEIIIVNKISDLTYRVVAFSEIPDFNTDECVDWAIEMISLGFETPNLLILAGLSLPTNFFVTLEYLKQALIESKLKAKTGDEAILSYCSYFIKQIAQSCHIKENLKKIYECCQLRNYEKLIFDFYLLYWAWGELDYGNEYQEYWPDTNKQNIEDILKTTAGNWLKENEKYYAL